MTTEKCFLVDEEDIYDAVAQYRKDHPEPETTPALIQEALIKSLNAKVALDHSGDITLDELIEYWGSVKYTTIAQATLDHLERLRFLERRS